MTRARRPLDKTAFLEGIKAGIQHLHALRLVHNGINPSNIIVDEHDQPIIIDFDTYDHHGEKLGPKGRYIWLVRGRFGGCEV